MPNHALQDRSELEAIAAELDRHADSLRARAARVGADPSQVRWSSLGARAWAEGVTRIQATLLRAAGELEQAASTLRGRAGALVDAGRGSRP